MQKANVWWWILIVSKLNLIHIFFRYKTWSNLIAKFHARGLMPRVEWAKSSETLDSALDRYEEKVREELLNLVEKEMEIDAYHLSWAIRQYGRGFVRHHKDNPNIWNVDSQSFSGWKNQKWVGLVRVGGWEGWEDTPSPPLHAIIPKFDVLNLIFVPYFFCLYFSLPKNFKSFFLHNCHSQIFVNDKVHVRLSAIR